MVASKNLETQLLESIQSKIKQAGKKSNLDEAITTELMEDFGQELGIIGARVWKIKDEKDTVLLFQKGGRKRLRPGLTITTNYEPIQETLRNGISIMNSHHPSYNPDIEKRIGAENFISIKLSPNKILAIEVDDIQKAKPALQLIKVALDTSIKNKELEDITQFARKIEKALLPKQDNLPLKDIYDISWYAKPARAVGGDLLVFKELDQDSMAISIGDAKGKGISAATVILASYFGLDMGTEFNSRSTILMEKLNNSLIKCDITTEYISLFYSTLHKNGVLNYINGGHPYPILFHKSNVKYLDKGGIILGIDREAKYEPGTAFLEKNDVVFLYTDGLSEVTNKRGKQLGTERLEKIVSRHRQESAPQIKNLVLEEIRGYMGDKGFQDDVTFAIIKKYK